MLNAFANEMLWVESQRDSVSKPRVASGEQPWESPGTDILNPNGVAAAPFFPLRGRPPCHNPVGVADWKFLFYPGLLAARNPGLWVANPLGLKQDTTSGRNLN